MAKIFGQYDGTLCKQDACHELCGVALNYSVPINSRLSSKSGGSNGGGAPLAVRRGPGEPLWNGSPGASLPSFAALRKKVAPAGAKYPSSCSRPRHSGLTSSLLRIRRLRLLFAPSSRRLRRADFFAAKEIGERNRQREPIPKAVPFGILPHRPGGCGPLEIPRDSRETGDGRRETGDRRRETGIRRRKFSRWSMPLPTMVS